jgi:hypothetical protein
MIKIKTVEEKLTKTNKPYKRLELENGMYVSMWSDDPDILLAVDGAELDRVAHKDGEFWNLLPKGASAPVQTKGPEVSYGELSTKLNVMYEILVKMGKHIGMETPNTAPEVDEEMDPENIPF